MILCPSAPCEEGNLLIGRTLNDDNVKILKKPIKINVSFVEEAKKHRTPEKRFRFASSCKQKKCRNWNGDQCTIPDTVEQLLLYAPINTIPECGIRNLCRWHLQSGENICLLCPFITTQRGAENDN